MKIKLIAIFTALLPLSAFWLNADENDNARKEIPLTQTYNGEYVKDNCSINTTTGEPVCDSNISITTHHILSISSTSGHYIVTYITENGDAYEGSFIIQ